MLPLSSEIPMLQHSYHHPFMYAGQPEGILHVCWKLEEFSFTFFFSFTADNLKQVELIIAGSFLKDASL